jgi:hypothetical protein
MCDVMNTTYIVGRYAAPTDPYYYNARPALGCQQALPGTALVTFKTSAWEPTLFEIHDPWSGGHKKQPSDS